MVGRPRPATLEKIKSCLTDYGGRLLSETTDNMDRLSWVCPHGHESRSTADNLLKGHRCIRCRPNRRGAVRKQIPVGSRNGPLEVVKNLEKKGLRSLVLVKNLDNGTVAEMTTHDFKFLRKRLLSDDQRRQIHADSVCKFSLQDLIDTCKKSDMILLHPVTAGYVYDVMPPGIWSIRCSCGTNISPPINSILAGLTRSCGCVRARQQADIFKWVQERGVVARANDRTQIAPLELDIWAPDKKVAIEYCGLWCHGEVWNGLAARVKHVRKSKRCSELGIRLVTIFEDEWVTRPDVVKAYLSTILGLPSIRVGARELSIAKGGLEFIRQFHLQGATGGNTYCLHLPSGEILAAASFSKPNISRNRHDGDTAAELSRFCIRPGYSVPGGLERLIKAWRQDNPGVSRLVSYSDNRWSAGGIYRRLGFRLVSENRPSYWYFKAHTSGPRKHRYTWRKSVAVKTFAADPALTEWQIMLANGWDRIWDCGSATWELQLAQP